MSVNLKKILKFTLLLLILLFFLYLAFKGVDFKDLLGKLKDTNYFYVIIAVLIGTVGGSYIRAIRWQYLLDPLKPKIPVSNLFSAVMIGYLSNAIIPRSGEVARPFILAKKEGISKASAFGTIVVERIFDMISMFLVFGLCLFFYREKISEAFGAYDIEYWALYVSAAIIIVVIVVVVMLFNLEKTERIVEKISKKILPERFNFRIHKIFISLINGFLFIKYPKTYFKIFFSSALIWICYALSSYITFFAFDINLNFIDANLVLTMNSFAMTLPLPANSAGTFHFFVSTTLIVIFGINKETSLAYATVSHLVGFIFILLIGFYFSVRENYKFSFMQELSGNNREK